MIDSPLYQAADEVLDYVGQLKDENDQPVFASSGFGIWLPSDLPSDNKIAGRLTPALRVWVSNPAYNVTTEQMFTGERDTTISIGIYHWLPTHNILSGTDGVIAADGVTFSSASGGISEDGTPSGFFSFDGYTIYINDIQVGYIDTVVNNNEVVLDHAITPGTGLTWWLRQSEVNPGRVMVNYVDYVLRRLQLVDVTGEGFKWTPQLWSPKSTQIIRPDLFGQLRKYNGNVPIQPPWFAAEIPLGADVWDIPVV